MQGMQEVEAQEGRCLGLPGQQGVPCVAANVVQIGRKPRAIMA
jgi:hypothetical protein